MKDDGVEKVLCAAMTRRRVIGDCGRLPWHLPEELDLFRTLTWGHSLIMGRKTFEAIGRPLPGRRNVVLSRSLTSTPGVLVCHRMEEAVALAAEGMRRLFFIGGADLYRQALSRVDTLHISWVRADYPGDTYFPDFERGVWQVVQVTEHRHFRHVIYRRRP
ncbi:dihydrofolate reductase [Desulfuromonas carbonis]|uniref:dihydrofolate reductase n=1 Tax=Desulfuromonas sp. DDH964 TaxID=1823759 RepID=UPI00078C7FC9|nr:dihydrofolate reductase [Desulfuromonas sp. DDH964]AMV71662.1 dihydrofolate reductase [Desulfuromonas sp. DDH964]